MVVPLEIFLSIEFLKNLILEIKVFGEIFENFLKIVAIFVVIFYFRIFLTAFVKLIVPCLHLEFTPETRLPSNG